MNILTSYQYLQRHFFMCRIMMCIIALLLFSGIKVYAYDFESGGIYYKIDGNNVSVTKGDVEYKGDIYIPSTVTYMGNEYSIEAIDDWTFYKCVGLKSLIFSAESKIKTIGYASIYATKLTNLQLPRTVETIEFAGLAENQKLNMLVIPESVKSIAGAGLLRYGCELHDTARIAFLSVVPPTVSSRFFMDSENDADSLVIYVPSSALSSYQTASGWKIYKDKIRGYDFAKDPLCFLNSKTEYAEKKADPVDLGLSVKWASWNMGASRIADYGGLYGAGDPTGQKTSTNPSDYYYKDGESICGTEYDLARVKWGEPWRMPTFEELLELRDKCIWEHNITIDGVKGSRATGPSGNSIFIPYAGAINDTGLHDKDYRGSLFSGDMGTSKYESGYQDLDILSTGNFQTDGCRNWVHQSIRPVYGDSNNGNNTSTKRTIHVATAGTLPNLISESEKYTIEELTLTGELNGTDFRLLRDMAGCDYLGKLSDGKLKVLDISKVSIVSGGKMYVDTNVMPQGYTAEFRYYIDASNVIPKSLFRECRSLESVILPSEIIEISESAFFHCNSLKSIILPQELKTIGRNAFQECYSLNNLEFPNRLTYIGLYAFYECRGLTSISIPSSVTSISNNVFESCSSLTTINVESGNTIYDSRNDCNAIIRKSNNKLIAGCKNTVIPNSVASIGDEAFYRCSGLTSISIPNSVTSIGNYAFFYCSGLTSINIPNSVTSIGGSAFGSCSGLTSISIPNSVTSIANSAFSGCSGLTSISIPNSVAIIGNYAFWGCGGLTSISIPNSVSSIGDEAFYRCSGLKDIISEIKTPFEINENVFSVYSTATLTVPNGTKSAYQSTAGWNKFTNIVEASGGNTSTKRTIHVATAGTLPNLISESEKYTIEELTLTGELNGTDFRLLRDIAGNNYLGQNTSGKLKVLDLTNAKVVAGGEKYLDTNSIRGNGIDSSGSFRYNISRNNEIPQAVFYGCYLRDILLPTTVTSIEESAFEYCQDLSSIMIPNSVVSIGYDAFRGCSGLTSIKVESENTIYDSRNNCNAIIRKSNNELIVGCKNTVIPNSVASIGYDAFYRCSGLTSISIPNSVTSIGDYAFFYCKGLTSITIPNSVTSIGRYAFYDCSGLTSISISNTVTSIGSNAFLGCSGLTSITIPSSVTSIGGSAFWDCGGLKDIISEIKTPFDINENVFSVYSTAKLTVPNGTKSAYQSTAGWNKFTNIVESSSNNQKIAEPIDLGLSVKWASWNIGASKPEEYGSYFSWGETSPKSNYAWNTYKFGNPPSKYNSTDNKKTLDSSDDAAVVLWGGKWRMPTNAEEKELYEKCKWTYTKKNGINGYQVTGPNGNTIFLPAAGLYDGNNTLYGANNIGWYWSSTSSRDNYALGFYLTSSSVTYTDVGHDKCDGHVIRPVYVESSQSQSIVVIAKNYTREYGDANPNFEYTVSGGTINGTPKITCSSTKTSQVGTYTIKIEKGSVTNSNVTYVDGTLTITKAPLTITAKSYTRKQGEANPTFDVTYSGFRNNETSSVLTKKPTCSTTATASSAPGTYDITVSGASATNYEISYVKGKLTVTQADAVIVTARNYTREYGEDNPTFGYTTSGATLNGTPSITCSATRSSAVGTYPIKIAQGSISNYNVTYVEGTLTITKAPLTITAKSYTRKQGEANPSFEVTYSGFKNGETASVLSQRPICSTTATPSSSPGTYDITVSGAYANNYDISYVNGKLTVTQADAVIVTARSYTREYGEDNPTFGYTTSGATLNGTPSITCSATKTSPVGTYPIKIAQGSVSNYNVTYVEGTLTITKAPLTITANSYTRKQGEANPTFDVTYSGFKNGETASVLSQRPICSTTATSSSSPGTYDITVSGAYANNYDISYVNGKLTVVQADAVIVTARNYTREYGDDNPTFGYTTSGATLLGSPSITCSATKSSPVGTYPIKIAQGSISNYNVSYVEGTLTITKAPLTITANSYTRKQGEANPTFDVSYSGFKNGETASVLTQMPTCSTTATPSSSPGTYDITVSGASATNYDISYVNGRLTVTQADAVIVTARNYTREYGDDNPNFDYNVNGATLTGTPTITCTASKTSPVGTYPIVIAQGSISNYNVTYVEGTLTITKAPLTITAKSYTREEEQENPTFEVIYSSFKNGETESVLTQKPTVSTNATLNSTPGSYDIIPSGATAENYNISYVNGILTVTEKKEVTFDLDGITYICTNATRTAEVNSVEQDLMNVKIPSSYSYNGKTYEVTSIANDVFSNRTFNYVWLPSSVTSISDNTFSNSTLGALVWSADAPLTSSVFSNMAMPTTSNFLLFVNSESYAPSNVSNVIVGNTASSITLADGTNTCFYCPQAFIAQHISYTHKYTMETGYDDCAGWESIALPFDVQTIMNNTKNVELIPFAAYSAGSDKYPFWLCSINSNGAFERASSIKANTPYIISMPNNNKYSEKFNVAGEVTFSAENAIVYASDKIKGQNYQEDNTFYPCFTAMDESMTNFGLNKNGTKPGSQFENNVKINPFEAYLYKPSQTSGSRMNIVFEDDSEVTGIFTFLQNEQDQIDIIKVYNLSGQLIKTLNSTTIDEVKKDLLPGIYVINRKKVIVEQ